jgi:hypothetical protein
MHLTLGAFVFVLVVLIVLTILRRMTDFLAPPFWTWAPSAVTVAISN